MTDDGLLDRSEELAAILDKPEERQAGLTFVPDTLRALVARCRTAEEEREGHRINYAMELEHTRQLSIRCVSAEAQLVALQTERDRLREALTLIRQKAGEYRGSGAAFAIAEMVDAALLPVTEKGTEAVMEQAIEQYGDALEVLRPIDGESR